MKTISDNIRFLRKERGLTQRELADILGVSDKTVSKWENGAGLPDIHIIVPLSQALGVSTDAILKERPALTASTDRPPDRRRQLQENLTYLHEKRGISVSQLAAALGMNGPELSALLLNNFPSGRTGEREKHDKLVKLIVILTELIPLFTENSHMLISSLYTRLQRDNELCAETVESYAGLEPGTLEKYLSGLRTLPSNRLLSLSVSLFLLDIAFNPEDPFPRDT